MMIARSRSMDKLTTTTEFQQHSGQRCMMRFRRSCSAITEREIIGTNKCQPSKLYEIPKPTQLLRQFEQNEKNYVNSIEKTSKSVHNYNVFLGGSCNPTTWRKNLAIPYLQKAGVSFYNPQVDHWSPDLIEIEHAAKENATILFYVIDTQTRNIVSYIETANLAGYHKNLILTIHMQDIIAGSVIAGDQISLKEAKDIQEARSVLQNITTHQGVLVFKNTSQALSKIVQIINVKNYQNIGKVNNNINQKICDVFNIFEHKILGKIDIFDVRIAIQFLANPDLSESEQLNLISQHKDYNTVEDNHRVCITFEQFYAFASKNLQLPEKYYHRNEFHNAYTHRILKFLSQEWDKMTKFKKMPDIYLVGESDDDIQWKEDIAIPMIKKSNLTYYVTLRTDLTILLNTRMLLFVIPNNSRSLATMILAAYCINKNCKMVLCIQNFSQDNCIVRGEKLTQTAINDYNRGRMYLADLASRKQISVFKCITEAVEIAIQKTK